MAQKKREAVKSSGQKFNEMMQSEAHRSWKKDYDAQMRVKARKVGKWDPKKGKRVYE